MIILCFDVRVRVRVRVMFDENTPMRGAYRSTSTNECD